MTAWTRLLVRLGWRSACCGARIVAVPGWDRDECALCGRSPVSRRATVLVALVLGAVVVGRLALIPLMVLAAAGVLR